MIRLSTSLRLLTVVALGVAPIVLASRGGNLPNSAITRHLAGRYAGAFSSETAVPTRSAS